MGRRHLFRRLLSSRALPQLGPLPRRALPQPGLLPRAGPLPRLRPASVLLLAFVLGACSPSVSPTGGSPSTGLESAQPSQVLPSGSPSASAVEPSSSPTGGETPGSSAAPSPSGPVPSGGAAACSGSDANRTFYVQAAAGMAWAVYCPVLPDRWYLENGSYQLGNGGILAATYRGPNQAHISIVEGNVCAEFGSDVDLCAPRDLVIEPASMGDLTGALGRLGSGLVLDVDRGANPSWRVTGLGLSQADFEAIAAAFARVGG